MQAITYEAVYSLLKTDSTLTPADRAAIADSVRRHGKTVQPEIPSVMSRADAAKLLNRTARSVDQLAAQGVLSKVRLPGRIRACGFRKADVVALIEGRR